MDKPGPKVLRTGSAANQPLPSKEWLATLRRHLAIFAEHYRQPIRDISVYVYRTELSDLTVAELDAACREAVRVSEFMPVVATIRNAHKSLQRSNEGEFLGPPMLTYPEISQEEREAGLAEAAEFTAKLKAKLGVPDRAAEIKQERKIQLTAIPMRPLEEQRRILQDRGFLPILLGDGKAHDPRCLCPDCRKRRERTT